MQDTDAHCEAPNALKEDIPPLDSVDLYTQGLHGLKASNVLGDMVKSISIDTGTLARYCVHFVHQWPQSDEYNDTKYESGERNQGRNRECDDRVHHEARDEHYRQT